MGMYEAPSAWGEADKPHLHLRQGDILSGFPWLTRLAPQAIVKRNPKAQNLEGATTPASRLAALNDKNGGVFLAFDQAERQTHGLVLSATCDIYQKKPLVVAPIRKHAFHPDAKTDAEKWAQLSREATGLGAPRSFYLPAAPASMVEFSRSQADLANLQSFPAPFVQTAFADLGTTVILRLTNAAMRHLQYALSNFFARNAREDDEWPSDEDFRLKCEWLRQQNKLDELAVLEAKLRPTTQGEP